MEENTPSTGKSSLTYGLYLGIALIIASVIVYLSGNVFAKWSQWVTYIVMIIGIVTAQLNYRKKAGGIMSYGQALGLGVLTAFFASILLAMYSYVLYELIDPSLKNQIVLKMEEQLVTQGNLPEEQISLITKMISTLYKSPIREIIAVFNGTFTGLILSLITSIFTQKKPDENISG
jgi:hypothetical protein